MSMGEKIRELRLARRLSMTQLAKLLGLKRQSVSQWAQDKTAPTHENIAAMASIFGVAVSDFYPSSGNTATEILLSSFANAVPVLKWEELRHWPGETAGMLTKENREYIHLSKPIGEEAIALRIQDNSLDPYLSIGDEVVVAKCHDPQENKLVLVRISANGDVLIRRYSPRRGGAYDLIPEHPSYPTITVNQDNPAQILGVVVRILKYV